MNRRPSRSATGALIEAMPIRGRRILWFALGLCLAGMAESCGPCGAPLIPGVNWDPPQRQLQEPPEVTKEKISRFQGLTSAMTLDAVVGRCGQPTQKNRGNPAEWLYSLQDKSTIVVGAGPTGMLIYVYRVGPDGRHEYFLGG